MIFVFCQSRLTVKITSGKVTYDIRLMSNKITVMMTSWEVTCDFHLLSVKANSED